MGQRENLAVRLGRPNPKHAFCSTYVVKGHKEKADNYTPSQKMINCHFFQVVQAVHEIDGAMARGDNGPWNCSRLGSTLRHYMTYHSDSKGGQCRTAFCFSISIPTRFTLLRVYYDSSKLRDLSFVEFNTTQNVTACLP